jgi:hypothetical protein
MKAIVVTPQGPELYKEQYGKVSYIQDGNWIPSNYKSLEELRSHANQSGWHWIDVNQIDDFEDNLYRVVWADTHEPLPDYVNTTYYNVSKEVRMHNATNTRKVTSQKGVIQWQDI